MISIITTDYAQVVGRAAVTTTLSGCAGGIMGLIWSFWRNKVDVLPFVAILTRFTPITLITLASGLGPAGRLQRRSLRLRRHHCRL